MKATDALEVVRKAKDAFSDLGACDDTLCPEPNCLHVLPHMDEAIETLESLVERAGEPVAWQDHEGYVWADKVAADEYFEGKSYTLIPCYAIPTSAPGASHE